MYGSLIFLFRKNMGTQRLVGLANEEKKRTQTDGRTQQMVGSGV